MKEMMTEWDLWIKRSAVLFYIFISTNIFYKITPLLLSSSTSKVWHKKYIFVYIYLMNIQVFSASWKKTERPDSVFE